MSVFTEEERSYLWKSRIIEKGVKSSVSPFSPKTFPEKLDGEDFLDKGEKLLGT